MKILVHDNSERYEDFEVDGQDGVEIEEKLMDWFLECSSWDDTIEMLENYMDCTIKVTDTAEVEP